MVAIVVTEQHKKWARRIGYPLFALVAFVVALHRSFPYERIEERLQEFAGSDFDVTVDDARAGFFPGDVVLEGIMFKSRPAREGDKPVELVIDRLDIDLGVFAAITGTNDVEFEAELGAGTIEGHVVVDKSEARVFVESQELPLDQLPGIRTATGGVPMAGGISLELDVKLPKGKWRDAEGKMVIDCDGCTIGDGVAKIRPQAPGQANAFSEGGFTLPKLKLGKIGGRIVITKGVGKFEEFLGKSPDGEMYLDGEIRFDDPFVRSVVTAYMRFKAADQLVQREPKMGDIILMMKAQALRPEDGLMGLKITGPFNALRFIGSKISPVPTKDGGPPGGRQRNSSAARDVSGSVDIPRPSVNVTPPPPVMPQPTPGEGPPPTPAPSTVGDAYVAPPPPSPPPYEPPPPPNSPPTDLPRNNDVRVIPQDSDRPTPRPAEEFQPPPPTQMQPIQESPPPQGYQDGGQPPNGDYPQPPIQ